MLFSVKHYSVYKMICFKMKKYAIEKNKKVIVDILQ